MYINLLLDLSKEDLRKLFWKCIKIVTDFYNCLLKDFQIYTLPNFFFYNDASFFFRRGNSQEG